MHKTTTWPKDLRWALLGLLLLIGWEAGGADLAVSRWYGDAQGFAWRGAWFTRSVLHDGGRWLAGLLLALLLWDACRPTFQGPSRRARWQGLGVVLAGMLWVPTLKRFSLTSCPYDLIAFGGSAPHVPHWLWAVADGGPGHCFPSGHAVAGFAFLGTWFLWRDHLPRHGRWLLWAVLALGTVLGWAQVARGAHFVSHALWTAWLCFAWAALAQSLLQRRGAVAMARSRAAATAAARPELQTRPLKPAGNVAQP